MEFFTGCLSDTAEETPTSRRRMGGNHGQVGYQCRYQWRDTYRLRHCNTRRAKKASVDLCAIRADIGFRSNGDNRDRRQECDDAGIDRAQVGG